MDALLKISELATAVREAQVRFPFWYGSVFVDARPEPFLQGAVVWPNECDPKRDLPPFCLLPVFAAQAPGKERKIAFSEGTGCFGDNRFGRVRHLRL